MELKAKIKELIANEFLTDTELKDSLGVLLKSQSIEQLDSSSAIPLIELAEQLLQSEKKQNSILSGWKQFDEELQGFTLGEFIVVGGRPAMGKTCLFVDLASRLSESVPVLYISLDLSAPVLTSRFLSRASNVEALRIVSGKLVEQEQKKLESCASEKYLSQIHIADKQLHSMADLRALCHEMVKSKGVKVIMLDYIQLLSSTRYRHHRESEIAYFSRTLKEIARDTETVVICASQLSRAVEQRGGEKRPILSDLRESGAIEQDADKVLFLYRPEYYGFYLDENGESTYAKMDVIVAKNRMGPLTNISLTIDIPFCRVVESPLDLSLLRIDPGRLEENGLTGEEPPF
jgi:replicative DNA helicase